MKLKFNFNKRNKYKNICSIEGCNNSACGKYCNKHYHQIKRYGHIYVNMLKINILEIVLIVYLISIFVMVFYVILLFLK